MNLTLTLSIPGLEGPVDRQDARLFGRELVSMLNDARTKNGGAYGPLKLESASWASPLAPDEELEAQ